MTPIKPNVKPEGLYSIADVTRLMAVSRKTVERWLEQGYIDAKVRKIDQRRVIKGEDILRLWAEMED